LAANPGAFSLLIKKSGHPRSSNGELMVRCWAFLSLWDLTPILHHDILNAQQNLVSHRFSKTLPNKDLRQQVFLVFNDVILSLS
jgi:hypothetical protein